MSVRRGFSDISDNRYIARDKIDKIGSTLDEGGQTDVLFRFLQSL
jgi:hypothetical protein